MAAAPPISPDVLRAVKRLEILTRRLVQEALSGGYLSSFQGTGMEFAEVREYQPGDDVRHLDWNVTARLGRPFVKRFAEERELRVVFLVDGSASTTFGSGDVDKRRTAAELCAALALSAHRHRDLVGMTLVTDRIERHLPPGKGRGHVLRILRELLSPRAGGRGTSLSTGIAFLSRVLKRRATVFVVSDFQDAGFERGLSILRKRHDVIAVTVTDPREAEVPRAGVLELQDPETGETVFLDTRRRAVRERLRASAASRREALHRVFRKAGIDAIELTAGGPVAPPLLEFFRRRAKRLAGGR